MILIYTKQPFTSRLLYICSFIFEELMNISFQLTNNEDDFKNYQQIKINYSDRNIDNSSFNIKNYSLLFENGVKAQEIECFPLEKYKAFFKSDHSDFPFDIFAASFYLLSRYEEYLPHEKDSYGRYAHTNSLAFREGFLHIPLINIWIQQFTAALKQKFSYFTFHLSRFTFLPTYDIDIAYSYKYKGLLRNGGGFIKSPSINRIKVLLNLQKDPFDTYKWLDQLHEKHHLQPYYFFLVAKKNGQYDKNILPNTTVMKKLIYDHAKKYNIGLHPSWQSGDNETLLIKEKETLEKISLGTSKHSRQHYIRFNLPEGYRRLINAGFTDDYSMGYGSINGFRASVASSFYWYDLEKEEKTSLRIHPFCYMEANSYYEQKFTSEQAYQEMLHYYKICKEVGGKMISIWHNNIFGTDKEFAGWKEMYEQFIALVQQ